jgi:SPP1 gp7 family putative phage head morphogenesis protein
MAEPQVVQVAREYKDALLRKEAAQMQQMASQWLNVEKSLEAQMSALALEIERMRARGEVVSAGKIVQMERWQALQQQAKVEIAKYDRFAGGAIEAGQREFANLGVESAGEAIRASFADYRQAAGTFRQLPRAAVEQMVGLAGDGSPLRALLAESYPKAVDGMLKELVKAVGLGINPRDMARAMARGFGIGLDRSLVIARTEQLRAYREASRAAYQESGLVSGYKRLAAKQERTCAACLMSDGEFYELEAEFEEHPNGRCTLVPVVEGLPEVEWETGKDWFLGQDEEVQRGILGGGYDLWAEGEVELEDFVGREEDEVWGAVLRTVNPGG